MSFQTLDQVIGVNDDAGDLAKNVGVDLDLVIEVAGEVGEAVERALQIFGEGSQVGIGVGEDGIGIAEGAFELAVDIGGEQPFAQRSGVIQLGRGRGQIADGGLGAHRDEVEIGREAGTVGQDGGELVGEAQNVRQRIFDLGHQSLQALGDGGRFIRLQPVGLVLF